MNGLVSTIDIRPQLHLCTPFGLNAQRLDRLERMVGSPYMMKQGNGKK
jgi:hypothetical protein